MSVVHGGDHCRHVNAHESPRENSAGTAPSPRAAGEPIAPAAPEGSQGAGRRTVAVAAVSAVIVLFIVLSPWPLLEKLRLVGYACCAQAQARTLRIGGEYMPLDARDAGIYLAFLLGLGMALVVGRVRSVRWPPGNLAALLGGLFVAMVLDGINSSFETRGLHGLYHTTNALRVITGVGAGMALALLGLPLVNRVIWRTPDNDAVASDYGELAGFIVAAAVLIGVLLAPPARLFYPLSVLSVIGVLIGWACINGAVVAVATRREHSAITLSDGALFLLAGVALSLVEIWIVGTIRAATSH